MRMMAIGMVASLAACAAGADGVPAKGTGSSRSFDVAGFTGVELRGADDVTVKLAPEFSVRAEGPAKALDDLRIERRGDKLLVSRKSKSGWNWGGSDTAHIYVTMPRINLASVAGSGDMRVGSASGDRLVLSNAGSGSLKVDTLNVRSADVSIAGSGDVSARGSSEALDLSVAGSGDIDMAGVKARSAKVSIAGSGKISAEVDGPANVSILGSGDVNLGPRARCTTSKMGSGTVSCGN